MVGNRIPDPAIQGALHADVIFKIFAYEHHCTANTQHLCYLPCITNISKQSYSEYQSKSSFYTKCLLVGTRCTYCICVVSARLGPLQITMIRF